MYMKRYLMITILSLIFLFFISGCMQLSDYGKLRLQSGQRERVTIEALIKNWQDYNVYYAGLYESSPSAIMFDPKQDDRALEGDTWIRVGDQEKLADLIDWMWTDPVSYPRVWRVLGPNDEFYGFMFTGWNHVVAKLAGNRTMWVYDLPLSPGDARDRMPMIGGGLGENEGS